MCVFCVCVLNGTVEITHVIIMLLLCICIA